MADKTKQDVTTDIQTRLDWAEQTLYAMLHGEKPAIDPKNPEQSWLFEQMNRMYPAGYLCEEPKSYVALPDENMAVVLQYKGVTLREPLSKMVTTEARDLRKISEKEDLHNFKVFGEDSAYRYRKDILDQSNDADALILTRGGLMELYQWILFMRARLENTVPLDNKITILQNSDGFWDPLLDHLGGIFNVTDHNFVTATRHDTVETLDRLYSASQKSRVPDRGNCADKIEAGATIMMVTGNRKKIYDYNKVFKSRGTDVNCIWFQQKFDKPVGATEESCSYTGNLIEKIEEMYRHIRDFYGTENFREILKKKNYNIESSYLWFDDGGVEFEENLTDGPEFANCTYRMNPYKDHGPGAELKGVLCAITNQPFQNKWGVEGLVKRFELALERKIQEKLNTGLANPEVSTQALDRATAAIIPLKQFIDDIEKKASFAQIMEKTPIHFFQASTRQNLVFTPRPMTPALDTKNFLVSSTDPEGRTQAEDPHYVGWHSTTAQLVKSVARTLDFTENRKGLSPLFDRQAGLVWRLGTHQSLYPLGQKQGLDEESIKNMTGLYHLMPGNSGRFDLTKIKKHRIRHENGTKRSDKNAINNLDNFARRADGFLLTPDTPETSGDTSFWQRTFLFFSLIVGKQVNDKAISAKPLVVMECETWRPYVKILETYGGGLIPNMPDEMIDDIVTDPTKLVGSLNSAFSDYVPDEMPAYVFREGGAECPKELFRVTIYCSASTTDTAAKKRAHDFSFDLATHGFAVINGGGTGPDGLMHETNEGVALAKKFFKFLESRNITPPQTHISSIQCVDTEQEEGLCDSNDYYAVYPTIYQRMHKLQETNAEVVLPGGAGTFQEISGSGLSRQAGIYPIQNRPLAIVNRANIYDPFLKIIPQSFFERDNIHVKQTEEEALELMIKTRKDCGMEPELPYSEEEYQALKQEFMATLPSEKKYTTQDFKIS